MFKWTVSKKRLVFAILMIALVAVPLSSVMASQWLQVPTGWWFSGNSPVGVYKATGGTYTCDDYWIVFVNVPKSKIFNNQLAVSSTDAFNQAHIVAHGGLTGFFECNDSSGMCAVHLCGKDGWPYNGWNHKLELH